MNGSDSLVTKKVALYPFETKLEDFGDGDVEYVVSFRDFPHVIGSGATIDEALQEARGNLQALFEDCLSQGKSIPSPVIINEGDEPSGKVTVRMTKTLHKALIKRAEQEKMSLNSVINDAISKYVYSSSIPKIDSSFFTNFIDDYFASAFHESLKDYDSEKLEKIPEIKNSFSYPAKA
jgi:predicted RNase H-like HicB family nuclease